MNATSSRKMPTKAVRVRLPLYQAMEKLAAKRASDVTEEINRAVREALERLDLWPSDGASGN